MADAEEAPPGMSEKQKRLFDLRLRMVRCFRLALTAHAPGLPRMLELADVRWCGIGHCA